MDFKKLGQQVGKLKRQAEDKIGDRAEPDNLKRDAKDLRKIMSGDGSLAEKAKEAKEKVIDRDKEPAPQTGAEEGEKAAGGGGDADVVPDSAGTGENRPGSSS